jgi:two-component system CheB/CheR fusion protein
MVAVFGAEIANTASDRTQLETMSPLKKKTKLEEREKPTGATNVDLKKKARELEREVAVRREMESRLMLAMEVAEAANTAKSEFLASISHELRTPMAAITASAQLLLNSIEEEHHREVLEVIWKASNSVASLIENLLDLAQSESGKIELEDNVFELAESFDKWLMPFTVKARDNGIHLVYEYLVNIDDMLVGDTKRIQQVLGSLLDNAIKFTPNGHVECVVWDEEASIHSLNEVEDSVCLHFSVSDTGIGIRSDQIESVFEAFSHSGDSSAPGRRGPGLGLSIARQLIEMMDGKIWVESEPGSGSMFHFVIQLKRARRVSVKQQHRAYRGPANG